MLRQWDDAILTICLYMRKATNKNLSMKENLHAPRSVIALSIIKAQRMRIMFATLMDRLFIARSQLSSDLVSMQSSIE